MGDISGSVPANTLVKVGGQEFMVEDYSGSIPTWGGNFAYDGAAAGATAAGTAFTDPSKSFRLTLSEPFLGTSIIPVLTDTGAIATAIGSAGVGGAPTATTALKVATSSAYLRLIAATVTTANTDSLVSGSDLFVSGCPITSMQNQFKMATNQEYLETFHTECLIDFEAVTTPPTRTSTRRLPTPPPSPAPATASAVAPPRSTPAHSTASPMPPTPTPSVVAPARMLPRVPPPLPQQPMTTPPPALPTPTCSLTTSAPSRSPPTAPLPQCSTSPRWTASPSSTPPLTTPRSPSPRRSLAPPTSSSAAAAP